MSAIIAGCASDADFETMSIGRGFIKSQTQVVMIDTFSLNMSTVKIDSVQTSGTGALLAGAYNDPNFGCISSIAYFPITLPDTMKLPDGSVFDSLTIILNYNGKWYGDTTKPLTLNIYHVAEPIEPAYDWYLYNTSAFSYEPEPVGTATFMPRPATNKSVELRLSDEFGSSIIDLFLNNSDDISSESEFVDFFNGLAIGPTPESKAVLGFEAADSVLHMVLYTHYLSSEKHQTNLRFPMYADGNTCNQIISDHSATNLANLVTQKEELNSLDSENKTYLQGGTGIATRFDFIGINKLLELNKGCILYKAELEFKPYPKSYNLASFPTSLNIYKTDKFNRMVSLITDDDENAITAEYSFDFLFGEETWYRFDITDFLLTELEDSYFDPDVGLLVTLDETSFQSTLDRVVLDARPNKSFKPLLKLYFLYYD
jgi:hypothetical protein